MKQDNYFPWWLGIITGVFLMFIGWHLIDSPAIATVRLMQLLGLYWIVAGAVDIVSLLFDRSKGHTGLRLAGGLLGIVAGIIVLNNAIATTLFTVTFVTYLIGFAFIFNGVVSMIMGRSTQESKKLQWSWGSLIVGIIYALFGLLIVGGPVIISATAFIWAAGFFAIFTGITLIVSAFMFKDTAPAK